MGIIKKSLNNNLDITVPAGIYLLKVINKNTRARYEICSKLAKKTPERRLNFEYVIAV